MKPFDLNLDDMLKRLHLASARRAWRALVARAEKEEWTHHDVLSTLVAEEVAHRQQTRIQRYSQRSRFPFLKTVDDFDFTYQSTVKLALLGSALSPDFVTDGRNILHGNPAAAKRTLPSPSAIVPSRTASTRSSSPPPSSSRTFTSLPATVVSPTLSSAMSRRTSSSSTRSAT
jgi:hypothetical protein